MVSRWTIANATLLAFLALSPRAHAQSESELRAARELFQDAYRDEQDRRYPEALEKFQRVARVKETGAVRYRIASVLADMGRLREARDIFRALARAATPSDAEIAASAADEAAALDRRIPKVTLRIEAPPSNARVYVDGAPVPARTTTIELDPGEHIVAAKAGEQLVQESTLHLGEGKETRHTVTFGPRQSDATLPIALTTAGGALLVTSAIFLALREGAIADIRDTCPNDVCPTASRSDVESDRDRANLYRPLALGLGIGGIVAAGVGVYLVLRHPTAKAATRWQPRGFAISF